MSYSRTEGPSDSTVSRHGSPRAGPQPISWNGTILNDFEIKNADGYAESTSNSSKLRPPKSEMPRRLHFPN
jgi:hypothetical protein